jgi:hypothetical protein
MNDFTSESGNNVQTVSCNDSFRTYPGDGILPYVYIGLVKSLKITRIKQSPLATNGYGGELVNVGIHYEKTTVRKSGISMS